MKIGICSDHAGYEYKTRLIPFLEKMGHEVIDFGTDSEQSMDYPDAAHPLGYAIDRGEVECGVAMCGTGNGMALALNAHPCVRAGLAWGTEVGRLIKAHNNANVLVMPARFISYKMVQEITKTWLSTPFEGGRHQRRIDKIDLPR